MRRCLLTAGALILATGTWLPGAGAGAAAPRVTCTSLRGALRFTPPLEMPGSSKKYITKLTVTNAVLDGCTGAPTKMAHLSFSATTKAKENCSGMQTGYAATGTETITWLDHSTTKVTLTVSAPQERDSLRPLLRGPVSSGLLKGSRQNARAYLDLAPGAPTCQDRRLGAVRLHLSPDLTPKKFTIG